MNFPGFLDIIGLAMIGWIAHNRFSKNGNLIACHTSKENKKCFEILVPVNQLNFHCFSDLWKNGESSTTLTHLINFQIKGKKDKIYVVVAASDIGGFFLSIIIMRINQLDMADDH